ncbi:hypothetical protein MHYP_G00217030 [Metynnis hypsauchen]
MLSTTVFKAAEVRVSSDLETMPCHPSIHPLKNINMAWEGLMSTALYRAKSSKMAQLAKRPKNCVEGYLHESIIMYVTAEKYGTPVKIEDTTFQPSSQKMGESDMIAGVQSKLCSLRNLPFPFDVTNSLQGIEQNTSADILADPVEYQRVHVTVKVLEERERGTATTSANKTLSKILKFFGKATLTTTAQTNVEPVPDAGLAAEAVRDDAQLVCGEIFSSDVVLEYYRPRRRLLNGVQPGTLMTRCHQCGAFIKNAETSTEIEGKISVVDERGDQCSISVD